MNLSTFEGLCDELSRRPAWATEQIQNFRNTDEAHSLCMQFLHESMNPTTQFQILSVLQHTSLKYWDRFSADDRNNVRTCIWAKILGHHASMPQYVLGKAYQVFALTWKCGWSSEQEGAKQELFVTINANLVGLKSLQGYRAAAELLHSTLDEFGSRSSAQIGASLEFHRVAHLAFEKFGLLQTFDLALQLLQRVVETLPQAADGAVSLEQCAAIEHTSRLMESLLMWDFGCPDMLRLDRQVSSKSSKDGSGLLTPPVEWASRIIRGDLVHVLTKAHTQIVSTLVRPPQETAGAPQQAAWSRAAQHAASATRELLTSLASLSGDATKADPTAYATFVEALSEAAAGMLSRCADPSARFFRPLLGWAGTGAAEEVRATAVEGAILFTQRLLGNLRLKGLVWTSVFDSLLSYLVQLLVTLATELRGLSRRHWARISSGVGVSLAAEDDSHLSIFGVCDMLLDGWRGASAAVLLDTLSLLQDDPSLVHATDSATLLSENQRDVIQRGGQMGFELLFEAVLFFSLFDAIDSMDDDEDEDVEEIVMRNLDEFIAGIAAVGRLNSTASVSTVMRYLREALTLASGLMGKGPEVALASSIFVLETARVSSLFLTKLLVDTTSSSSPTSASGEAPQIPALLLGAVPGLLLPGQNSGISPAVLSRAHATGTQDYVWGVVGDLLQMQKLSAVNRSSLASPLVTSIAMNFFASYVRTYVDADPELYDRSAPGVQQGLLQMHTADFAPALEAIFDISLTLLQHLPLEEDAVSSVAAFIHASSRLTRRVDALLSLSSVQGIFQLITMPAQSPARQGGCRLSARGLRQMWSSMAALATRCSDPAPFNQLLAAVHARVGGLASLLPPNRHVMNAGEISNVRQSLLNNAEVCFELELCLAICGGVALAPLGRTESLAMLMDQALPVLTWFVEGRTVHVDALLLPTLSLIRDYAEGHLTALTQQSCSILYLATAAVMKSLAARLNAIATTVGSGTKAEAEESARWEESFLADVLLLALEVLFILANQDLFDVDSSSHDFVAPGAAAPLPCVIGGPLSSLQFRKAAEILLFGLGVVAPVLSPALLRGFPAVAEKYFSFVQYVLSALSDEFSKWLCGNPRLGAVFLRNLSEQLLWGAGGVDASAARMALQCMQLMAGYHHRALARGEMGLKVVLSPQWGHASIFFDALRRLLEIIIYPASSDYGIAWDRVDACANAFITLVALDQTSFNSMAHGLINQQEPQHRESLMACFGRMTTANGVQMGSIDRPNRAKFVANMRTFVNEIRPLVLYR